MIVEQMQIVVSFIITVIFFSFQEIGIFFIVMDQPYAIVCTLIILIGLRVTYSYTLRIYNRFYWTGSTAHWVRKKKATSEFEELESDNDIDPTDKLQEDLNAMKKKGTLIFTLHDTSIHLLLTVYIL